MPVRVENSRVPELHFMYLANTGCPQPNPVPNGNLIGMVPHVSRQVPLNGMGWTMAERGRRKEVKIQILMIRHRMKAGDIAERVLEVDT